MVHFALLCTSPIGTRNSLWRNDLEHLEGVGILLSYVFCAPTKGAAAKALSQLNKGQGVRHSPITIHSLPGECHEPQDQAGAGPRHRDRRDRQRHRREGLQERAHSRGASDQDRQLPEGAPGDPGGQGEEAPGGEEAPPEAAQPRALHQQGEASREGGEGARGAGEHRGVTRIT